MFSAFTGAPYGARPIAVPGDGPLARADVLRGEIRDAALQHRAVIDAVAVQMFPDYQQGPHLQELTARLGDMAEAVLQAHGWCRRAPSSSRSRVT